MTGSILAAARAGKTPKIKPITPKKWLDNLTLYIQEVGFLGLYGEEFRHYEFQRHHVLGKTAKHNKVAIGLFFVIPVPTHLHDVSSNHPDNVTHFKKRFTQRFGPQREIFKKLCDGMKEWGFDIPPADVIEAIMDTSA